MHNLRRLFPVVLILRTTFPVLILSSIFVTACVSKQTHLQTVVELEQSKRQVVESELKGRVLQTQYEQVQQDNKALKQEQDALKTKTRDLEGQIAALQRDVTAAKQALAGAATQGVLLGKERDDLRAALATANEQLIAEQAGAAKARQELQTQVAELKREQTSLTEANVIVAKSRAELQAKLQELQQALQAVQQDAGAHKRALEEGKSRTQMVDKEKQQLMESLGDTRASIRDLEKRLAAEQAKADQARQALEEHTKNSRSAVQTAEGLQQQLQAVQQTHMKDKQALEEATRRIAMLNDQIVHEKERADTFAAQIADREKEIEKLRDAAADRETLAARVTALSDELDQANKRIATLDQMMNKVLFGR